MGLAQRHTEFTAEKQLMGSVAVDTSERDQNSLDGESAIRKTLAAARA